MFFFHNSCFFVFFSVWVGVCARREYCHHQHLHVSFLVVCGFQLPAALSSFPFLSFLSFLSFPFLSFPFLHHRHLHHLDVGKEITTVCSTHRPLLPLPPPPLTHNLGVLHLFILGCSPIYPRPWWCGSWLSCSLPSLASTASPRSTVAKPLHATPSVLKS